MEFCRLDIHRIRISWDRQIIVEFFSSDYKKSQQRKEVDKNLDKVCGIIEERVRNKIEDAKKGICEKVENLKARLNDPVVCYERMREGLIKAGESLWQIDNNIKTRIAQ
nr:hypothetical protein [Helicobacter pylori]